VAVVAVASYLTQTPVGRGYLLLVIPAGLLALLANRWAWRRRLVHDRRRGADLQTAVVVGTPDQVADVERRLSQQADPVWRVAARVDQPVLTAPSRRAGDRPLLDVESVLAVAREHSADTIIVAGGECLPPGGLRELGWALRGSGTGIAVAPSVVDVAGPRIHVRPVAGLALLHLEEPSFTRGGRVLKRAVDLLGAAAGLVLLSPLLLAVGLLIRATSDGPAVYRQQRVGYDGSSFSIWKFRTMADNADAELQRLLGEQGKGQQPLFKLDHDPRITRVGRVLREYSLDEFPQLVNVLLGDMSLVGPRPQVDAEVALYTRTHRRRLLAKPGMTGLWQVSGRNEVAWEDAAELDLYYVENWSLGLDVVLLLRTVVVVLRGARGGAR
jgi:exopolysaccharide biosynthesis polyprenyl glycosylphosphotransferase